MKLTGKIAIALCVLTGCMAVSCMDDDDSFDYDKALKLYEANFIGKYGYPDPDHSWGFGAPKTGRKAKGNARTRADEYAIFARGADANPAADNDGCKVDMFDVSTLSIPDLSTMADLSSGAVALDAGGVGDRCVPAGAEVTTTTSLNMCSQNVYVFGTLNLTQYWGDGNGIFYIMPGGKLNISVAAPDRATFLVYGEINVLVDDINFNQSTVLKVAGDLAVKGTLATGNETYVGGNLKCAKFNPYQGSANHVVGDMTLTGASSQVGTNNTSLCVEGTFKGQKVELNSNCKFHVGCKMYAYEELYLTNNAKLAASYIYSPVTKFNSGATMTIAAGGTADLGDLYMDNTWATRILTATADATATVNCKTFAIMDSNTLTNKENGASVLSSGLTVNYMSLLVYRDQPVDAFGQAEGDVAYPGCANFKTETYDAADPGENNCVHTPLARAAESPVSYTVMYIEQGNPGNQLKSTTQGTAYAGSKVHLVTEAALLIDNELWTIDGSASVILDLSTGQRGYVFEYVKANLTITPIPGTDPDPAPNPNNPDDEKPDLSDVDVVKRVLCEDLGDIADLDFNDLVFDARWDHRFPNKLYIKLRAAGGTLPIYIENPSTGEFIEAHEKFGVDRSDGLYTPINVGYTSESNIECPAEFAITFNRDYSNGYAAIADVPIYVKNGGVVAPIGNRNGATPQIIAVPTTVRWTRESQLLSLAYSFPEFCLWVRDESHTDSDGKVWYECINNSGWLYSTGSNDITPSGEIIGGGDEPSGDEPSGGDEPGGDEPGGDDNSGASYGDKFTGSITEDGIDYATYLASAKKKVTVTFYYANGGNINGVLTDRDDQWNSGKQISTGYNVIPAGGVWQVVVESSHPLFGHSFKWLNYNDMPTDTYILCE